MHLSVQQESQAGVTAAKSKVKAESPLYDKTKEKHEEKEKAKKEKEKNGIVPVNSRGR